MSACKSRIVFLMSSSAAWEGGVNYYINLAATLQLDKGRERDIVFLCRDGVDAEVLKRLQAVGRVVKFRAERGRSAIGLVGFIGVLQKLLNLKPTIVFYSSYVLPRMPGVKLVYWIPDFQHEYLPKYFPLPRRLKRRYGHAIAALFSHRVVVSSSSAASDASKFLLASKKKLFILKFRLGGLDCPDSDRVNNVLHKYNLPRVYVIVPNQFWPHKNHLPLLREVISNEKSGAYLVLTGRIPDDLESDQRADVDRMLDELEGANRGVYLGIVPWSDIPCLMAGASGFINPSEFEGWNTSVELARAFGKPMLLSDIGTHREQGEGVGNVSYLGLEAFNGVVPWLERVEHPGAFLGVGSSDAIDAYRHKYSEFVRAVEGLFCVRN